MEIGRGELRILVDGLLEQSLGGLVTIRAADDLLDEEPVGLCEELERSERRGRDRREVLPLHGVFERCVQGLLNVLGELSNGFKNDVLAIGLCAQAGDDLSVFGAGEIGSDEVSGAEPFDATDQDKRNLPVSQGDLLADLRVDHRVE